MEETGMFLFEIGLLNGFTVNLEKERGRNNEAKMVELDDDSVNVYFDQVEFVSIGKFLKSIKLLTEKIFLVTFQSSKCWYLACFIASVYLMMIKKRCSIKFCCFHSSHQEECCALMLNCRE